MTKFSEGYIALISVLVISSVVLTIGITMALVSVSELQASLAGRRNDDAVDVAEACVEDVLIRISKNLTIPSSLSLLGGTCSVTINPPVGTVWTFTVSGTQNTHTKSVQVVANRGSQVTITSWKEL